MLQDVRDQIQRLADRPASRAIAVKYAKVVEAHDVRYTTLSAGIARLTQVQTDAWRVTDALARNERGTDQAKESRITGRFDPDRLRQS